MLSGKKLLTASLLIFVLASAGVLIFKEMRRGSQLRAAESAGPSAQVANAPDPATPIQPGQVAPAPAGSRPEGGPQSQQAVAPQPQAGQKQAAQAPQGRSIVVTYFLTNTRCPSCYKIETYTQAAVTGNFQAPLHDGKMVFRTINTDKPENDHYLKDYNLVTKSVIVSEVVNGKEVRWKNLEEVWDLLDDQPAFETYIVKEVRGYLGQG